jgi:lipopolysaccharide transport system permease protein
MWRHLWALVTVHRPLVVQMAKRELMDRYVGQVFGPLWIVAHPLTLIVVYVFVFGFVFRVSLSGSAPPYDYTTYLLSGVIPWLGFQDALSKSSVVIPGNANLVKQVIFPVEVLPVKVVVASLATQAILIALQLGYMVVVHGTLPWTSALTPLLVVLQAALMVGVCFAVSAMSVFFRDIKDVVQVFGTIGLYLVPALYLPESVPSAIRPLLYVNPLSHLVWCYQDALYFGRVAHPFAWAVLVVVSVVSLLLGTHMFRATKTAFGNLL